MTEQSGHKAMAEIRRLRLEVEAYTPDAPEEDAFWAEERARAVAQRGRQADPSACGTCRDRVAAGGQVEHDECAQRATLLPAPDAPGYELITGMTEDDVRALPARFHTPVFSELSTPNAWVCAVCWGDGWSTAWPCPTAVKNGTAVFTPEHQAETGAKKQAAEVERLSRQVAELQDLLAQAERDAARALHERDAMRERVSEPHGCMHCGTPQRFHGRQYVIGVGTHGWERPTDEQVKTRMLARRAARQPLDPVPLVVARFDTAMEHAPEEQPGLTVGAIAENGRPVALVFDEEARAKVAGWLAPTVAQLQDRVAELETELAYAKRPSYSNRHVWTVWREDQPIHAHYATLDDARQGSIDCWEEDEPVCPDYSWKPDGPRLELLVGGEASGVYISRNDVFGAPGPALPWAAAMSDDDLHEFLGDLVSAAMGRWRSEPEVPDRTVLADIEKACAQWRTPGQGLRSDEPETETRRT